MGSSHEQTSLLESELATRTNALHDAQARLQESHEAVNRLKHELSNLTNALADRDTRIAELQHHLSEQPMRIESAMRQEQVNTADRLERRIEELTALSREISEQRYSFNRERHELAALAAATMEPPPDSDHFDNAYERAAANFEEVTNQERSIDRMLTHAERETLALAAEVERLEPLRAEFPQLAVPEDMRPTSGRLVEPRETGAAFFRQTFAFREARRSRSAALPMSCPWRHASERYRKTSPDNKNGGADASGAAASPSCRP